MNRHHIFAGLLALGSALFGAGAQAQAQAGKAYELYVTPLPNTHQQLDSRMSMELQMDLQPRPDLSEDERAQFDAKAAAMKGPMTVTMTMRQTIDTGAMDKQGRVPMKSEMLPGTMEMRNAEGALLPAGPARPAMRFSAVLNKGRYESIAMEGEAFKALPADFQEKTFRQMFDALARLEGAKLRVGESIDVPLTMSLPVPAQQAASLDGKLNARYTLRRVEKGVAEFDVGVQLDMAIAPDAAASATAPKSAGMQIRADGTGQMQLRLADRLPLRNTMDMNMLADLQMADGTAMKMRMKMSSDMTGSKRQTAKR